MKLRNVYLGFKDQLPFLRLVKNIVTLNIVGVFYKRSHLRDNGNPKVTYNTKVTAVKSANQMAKKTGNYFSSYKCFYCDGFHIGKKRNENK